MYLLFRKILPKKLHCGPTTVSWVKLISGCTPNTAMCRTITNGQRISGDKLGRRVVILVKKLQSLDFNLAKIIFVFEMVLGINDEMIRSFCCLQSLIYFYICNILAKTINRNYVRCVLNRVGELIYLTYSWNGGFLFFSNC